MSNSMSNQLVSTTSGSEAVTVAGSSKTLTAVEFLHDKVIQPLGMRNDQAYVQFSTRNAPTSGRWTVRYVFKDVVLGQGVGTTVKAAKEIAARCALEHSTMKVLIQAAKALGT